MPCLTTKNLFSAGLSSSPLNFRSNSGTMVNTFFNDKYDVCDFQK